MIHSSTFKFQRTLFFVLVLHRILPYALGQCSGSSEYLQRFVAATAPTTCDDNFGNQKWPEGLVPFQLDSDLSDGQAAVILDAMTHIMNSLPDIKFLPRLDNQSSFIHVRYQDVPGCGNSKVGMQPAGQCVNVDCVNRWVVIHELLHALGYPHEQSRPDREMFVEILTGNIESGREGNFDVTDGWLPNSTDTPYDFRSVMHYSECAFSTCGLLCTALDRGCWTIVCRDAYEQYQDVIGNKSDWGDYDVKDLVNVYGWHPNYLIDWHNVSEIPETVPWNAPGTDLIWTKQFWISKMARTGGTVLLPFGCG